MNNQDATTLILLRHAPPIDRAHCHGRSDVAADCAQGVALPALRARLRAVDGIVTSPARRCIQTLDAIWPDQAARPRRSAEPRLWEQDFGAWEGVAYDKLPDLGALSLAALAAHRPPGGESFADVCARTQAALADMLASRRGQTLCLCAHAGSIRAALALALGAVSAALCFRIDYLSLTVLRHFGDARWSVDGVNQSLPA